MSTFETEMDINLSRVKISALGIYFVLSIKKQTHHQQNKTIENRTNFQILQLEKLNMLSFPRNPTPNTNVFPAL